MRVILIIAALGLAACGADGDPVPPAGSAVGGEVQIGVVGEL